MMPALLTRRLGVPLVLTLTLPIKLGAIVCWEMETIATFHSKLQHQATTIMNVLTRALIVDMDGALLPLTPMEFIMTGNIVMPVILQSVHPRMDQEPQSLENIV